MLQYLKIRNLALMDEVALEFEGGFVAITGETGTGKSILLGALGFLAGARVDRTIVRRGADACEVEGGLFFDDTTAMNVALSKLELPACEDGCLILRRVFSRSKIPRIQVNGALTTLANLAVLGGEWIDFHGPGEPRKLTQEKWQRALLDFYGKHGRLLNAYGRAYHGWRNLRSRIDGLHKCSQISQDEAEFMQSRIDMIDQVHVEEASIAKLERDFTRLEKTEDLVRMASELSASLSGEGGVTDRIACLLTVARRLSEIDPESRPSTLRLEGVILELEDLSRDFEDLVASCDFDQEDAERLRERMEQWLEIGRNYGPDVASVRERRDEMKRRIQEQGDLSGTLARLGEEADALRSGAAAHADELRRLRKTAAVSLSRHAVKLMNRLGFKNAALRIEIVPESELREHGDTTCRFLISPNRGEDFLPLKKIASSGEAARVMLALKAVLAKVDATPILVFDEVDANIGGEIAVVVGEQLSHLGARHQVFCVTHLPQVAAQARGHYIVNKEEGDDATTVDIRSVHDDPDARRVELARMLGDRASEAALQHAAKLLS